MATRVDQLQRLLSQNLVPLCLITTCWLLASCEPKERQDQRANAQRIVSQYETVVNPVEDLHSRRQALQSLRTLPCTDNTCRDRDLCVKYGELFLRAKEATAVASASAKVRASNELLGRAVVTAEDAVREAEGSEADCHAALRRLYEQAR